MEWYHWYLIVGAAIYPLLVLNATRRGPITNTSFGRLFVGWVLAVLVWPALLVRDFLE